MASETRVRFAPSPTGALHIGGARAALYNWLVARQSGGAMVLRIEDTDRERSTPENVEQILDALRWLELDWDEGPISQVERSPRHQEVLADLLARDLAYRTTATAEDVKAYKQEHGDAAGFRGTPSADGEGAVRLRVPDGDIVVDDLIRGEAIFKAEHLDEPVIARADGSVLYNFAVAVDDHDAGITHVIRGEDHLSNTPKQLLVYAALGAAPPAFAHLPLLHGHDGKKLSKRHGATGVDELRAAGYLAPALLNFLALLGWAPDGETTLMSREDLVDRFELDRVIKSAAAFDYDKLDWLNGVYLRALPADEYADALVSYLRQESNVWPEERIREAAPLVQEKIGRLGEFPSFAGFLFHEVDPDPALLDRAVLESAAEALGGLEAFEPVPIESALKALCERLGLKPRQAFAPIRVAVTGSKISPGLYESLALLGRETAVARLRSGAAAAA